MVGKDSLQNQGVPQEKGPWERLQKESSAAFEAFQRYVGMGAGRSIAKVAQELSKSETLLKRWSSQWKWQERARAWDDHLNALDTQDQERQHLQIRREARKATLKLAERILERLDDAEAVPAERVDQALRNLTSVLLMLEGKSIEQQNITVVQADRVQVNQQFGEAMAEYMAELLDRAPPQVVKWIHDKVRRRQNALGSGPANGG